MLESVRNSARTALAWTLLASCLLAASLARADGCQKDAECKGERVCQVGVCVDPVAPTTPLKAPLEAPGAVASGVLVHVESNEPEATLSMVMGNAIGHASGPGGVLTPSATDYRSICSGSCDAVAPANQLYVFQGVAGLQGRSPAFRLPARELVTLRVDSGSKVGYAIGLLGTVGG